MLQLHIKHTILTVIISLERLVSALSYGVITGLKTNSEALVCERTIPAERPRLVGEVGLKTTNK
jgi:hypothetical protein